MEPIIKFLTVVILVLFSTVSWSATYLTGDAVRSPDRTKTWLLPPLAGTLSTLANSEVLTNKTMSGASNTFSAIPYSALNLTGSLVPGDLSSGFVLPFSKLATGSLGFNAYYDATTGQLTGEQYVSKSRGGIGASAASLTFPTTGTLATQAGTETLTGKTMSGASNTFSQLPVGVGQIQVTPSGTVNGSNTTFTLTTAPPSNAAVVLYRNGITLQQGAGNDYTISGSTITMLTAPAAGQKLLAVYLPY